MNNLWWRRFTHGDQPDQDILADDAFLKNNFMDHFGILLQNVQLNCFLTFDQVIHTFWDKADYYLQIFCVADGADIAYNNSTSAWFDPGVRFAAVVSPKNIRPFQDTNWTIFIVGSAEFDSKERFLQVASWNGDAFRFYGRGPLSHDYNIISWIYQGSSWDAFKPESSYLGPFNGHINGAPIMKELQNPWLHWHSAAGSVSQCLSPAQTEYFKTKPYLSTDDLVLGKVKFADQLESIVRSGVSEWYAQRMKHDFKDSNGSLKQSPSNIPRWVAHLLLTTTINIHCGELNGGDDTLTVPPNHFFNDEILKSYPGSGKIYPRFGSLSVRHKDYENACSQLGLALLKEVSTFDNVPENLQVTLYPGSLGAGKHSGNRTQVLFAKCLVGEGSGPFTILTPSLEDSRGVLNFQKITKNVSLVSQKLLDCLVMADYWNPVYSWRRGILMQYMPASTTLKGKTYDLEENFIQALKSSAYAKCAGEVENEFLRLYECYDLDSLASRISSYVGKVQQKLRTSAGVLNYLLLAESRRRIYRPLPLNEFGLTLPFAVNYPTRESLPLKEMTESGEVVNMPERGKKFLTEWTGTLWSDEPMLLPSPKAYSYDNSPPGCLAPTSPLALPKKERTPKSSIKRS
ncbi:hypothetical protein Asppvi_003765 [Aspergillus pseudoviridinutans]|uniref:Uncharacterized protein n=1 Tax=Aspergillus pseudoviridinutans TaxID=1517512 RepID=A0A9P3BBG3_9EURO|nr:uncharacterized protein Asppvi_003765 [Aspergillus pseudoviridinutans]GIJ84914.1 hypothetical protein Asppvi_003765 [Aspergillus pseudoviridinutans]